MESCINDKLIFELRVKVVKKHAIWISGVTAIGTEEKKKTREHSRYNERATKSMKMK